MKVDEKLIALITEAVIQELKNQKMKNTGVSSSVYEPNEPVHENPPADLDITSRE